MRLRSIIYYSALSAITCDPPSRAYLDRKKAQGKRGVAALLCLARRRIDLLYSMLHDRTHYRPQVRLPLAPAA